MSEIEELKALVTRMANDAAKRDVEAAKRADDMAIQAAKMQEENAKLIAALANQPQVVQQVGQAPNAAAVRNEKLAKLSLALRKSGKVKDFKDNPECNVREWLKRFDQELLALKKMSGIDNDLQRAEIIDCLKDKLDYSVVKRLDTAFQAKDPPLTWAAVTKVQLQTVLIEEYGSRQTDVSSVLLQFGPNRLKKKPDMSVAKFFHVWQEQLPECLLPGDAAKNARFVDLIRRSLFYFCLEDKFLQEQLCNLKGDNLTLKMFFDEACVAEQKRKSFQEIGASSSHLDSSSAVSVSKWEPKYGDKSGCDKSSSGNDKFGGGGRGKHKWSAKSNKSGSGSLAHNPEGADKGPVQTRPQNSGRSSYSENHSTDHTGNRNRKKKMPGACFLCKQYGHFAYKCPDKQQYESVKKTEIVEDNAHPVEEQSEFQFHSLEIVASEACVKGGAGRHVDVKATNVKTPYATNQPLMTSVRLAGACEAKFECDTAASHNVISAELYQKLRQQSNYKIPSIKQEKVAIRLADGTISGKACGSVTLTVQARNTPTVELNFFVLAGPNNLLGRLALEKLWPVQYRALRDVASLGSPVTAASVDLVKKKSVKVGVVESQQKCTKQELGARLSDSEQSGVTLPPTHPITPPPDTPALPVEPSGKERSELPEKRELPPFPTGDMSQAEGEAFARIICGTYPEVFDKKKGRFKGGEATMFIKEGHMEALSKVGVRPAAKIPYGLEEEYERALDELYEDCVPVDGHEIMVASQVVPVCEVKNGKKVLKRLAINYKSTVNDHLQDIPHVSTSCDEQLDKLKGQYRSCIDLKGAFKQIAVTPGFSQKILAIVTPRGYAVPTRMQFGIKTAPAIWNSNMQRLIHGMDGRGPVSAACMVDDVCVTGQTPQEHFENLHEFIYRLYAAGLKANIDKCKFYQNEVKFLGKIVDRDGIRLDSSTTDAILRMPAPDDKKKLRSFLGHMSYIAKHVPDLRKARAPLDKLLKTDVKFVWEGCHQVAFDKCKMLASNSAMLTHFDPKKPLVLTTDASPDGVGACLSHKVVGEDGKVKLHPIAYASASLKPSEKGYSQIDREGLAIYWAIQHFRQYLWCQEFELHTDCSALVKIFGPKNDLGGCAVGRLNRYAAQLMEFNFTVKHIKGSSNFTADSLSRLPVCMAGGTQAEYPSGPLQQLSELPVVNQLEVLCEEEELMQEVQLLAGQPQEAVASVTIAQVIGETPKEAWDVLPLSISDVAKATREDKQYGKLIKAVRSGNLDEKDPDLKKFNGVFTELYIENEVLYFGSRVVIPTVQHLRLLTELHFSHIGAVKMKETVRRYFWWPGITKDIDAIAASCDGCRRYRKKPPPAPLCPWPYSRRPMERVHVDFFEYKGKMVLIMVDSFSKKIWTALMNTDTTATKTLAVLFGWFCDETGIPTTLVSDNGPQFTSKEFGDKMSKWGVNHLLTPPYHPASNGLAERAVGLVKDRLKKMDCSAAPVQLYVGLKYICRIHGLTPHSSTGRCPYELVKEGPLPSMFPRLTASSSQRRETTAVRHSGTKLRSKKTFSEDEEVTVYDNRSKLSATGKILEVLGNNTYLADCGKGPQHISGDLISKVSEAANREIGGSNEVQQEIGDDNLIVDRNVFQDDDTMSIASESSIGSDFVAPPNNDYNLNVNVRRRRRTQLDHLGPADANLQRLRPR